MATASTVIDAGKRLAKMIWSPANKAHAKLRLANARQNVPGAQQVTLTPTEKFLAANKGVVNTATRAAIVGVPTISGAVYGATALPSNASKPEQARPNPEAKPDTQAAAKAEAAKPGMWGNLVNFAKENPVATGLVGAGAAAVLGSMLLRRKKDDEEEI